MAVLAKMGTKVSSLVVFFIIGHFKLGWDDRLETNPNDFMSTIPNLLLLSMAQRHFSNEYNLSKSLSFSEGLFIFFCSVCSSRSETIGLDGEEPAP